MHKWVKSATRGMNKDTPASHRQAPITAAILTFGDYRYWRLAMTLIFGVMPDVLNFRCCLL
jgi:hypothetical protein